MRVHKEAAHSINGTDAKTETCAGQTWRLSPKWKHCIVTSQERKRGRMRRRVFFCIVALSFLCTFAFWTARGQSFAGALKGLLTDPGDALIPAAQVTLTNAATGTLLKTVSNGQG